MRLSTDSPSASALKFRTIRWRNTGFATARTSSMSGEYFPLRSALHFAPSTRYCEARGPAPHSKNSVANAEEFPGLVDPVNLTAYSTTLSAMGTRHQMLKCNDVFCSNCFVDLHGFISRCSFHNLQFLLIGRVIQKNIKHEAVKLR